MTAESIGVTNDSGGQRLSHRIPALDGVRGLAIAMVMAYHFGRPEVPGLGARVVGSVTQFGWSGVDLFFVLSGFLIAGILVDSRERPGFFRTFYSRRTLRIFPLYFAFVAFYLFVIVPVLFPGRPTDVFARQKWIWTYLINFDIARHGWYSGVGSHVNDLWSLAIEEQFYLVFPLAVFLLRRRGLFIMAIGCVIGAILARVVVWRMGYSPVVAYVATFTRVDALGLGILLALMAREGTTLRRAVPVARVMLACALVGVVLLALRTGSYDILDWRALLIAEPILALGFASMLLLTVSDAGSPVLRKLFESRTLRFLGTYSYGLYIWHTLIGGLLRQAGVRQQGMTDHLGSGFAGILLVIAAKTAGSILVALVSYHLIERPFLRMKDRIKFRSGGSQAIERIASTDVGL